MVALTYPMPGRKHCMTTTHPSPLAEGPFVTYNLLMTSFLWVAADFFFFHMFFNCIFKAMNTSCVTVSHLQSWWISNMFLKRYLQFNLSSLRVHQAMAVYHHGSHWNYILIINQLTEIIKPYHSQSHRDYHGLIIKNVDKTIIFLGHHFAVTMKTTFLSSIRSLRLS